MATGRDASDVALTTSFGQADLCRFYVVTEEEGQNSAGANVPVTDSLVVESPKGESPATDPNNMLQMAS